MFEGDRLRILTPLTNQFAAPIYINGVQQFREDYAPIGAKKEFEKENAQMERAGRPELKHIIEIIRAQPVQPQRAVIAPAAETDVKPIKPQSKAKQKEPEDDIFQ